jgi:hypothetical protein
VTPVYASAVRAAITAFVSVLCVFPSRAGEESVGPIPRYASEILERSMTELRRRGENPDDFKIEVMDYLAPGMLQYFEFKKITDITSVWAVVFLPKPKPEPLPPGAIDVGRHGGDYTFFFRYPSTREFEIWSGE